MGVRSWFIPVDNNDHLRAIEKELSEVQSRNGADWGISIEAFFAVPKPLRFHKIATGTMLNNGDFAYACVVSDGAGWLPLCAISPVLSLDDLDSGQGGIDAPIINATYMNEEEAIAYLEANGDA